MKAFANLLHLYRAQRWNQSRILDSQVALMRQIVNTAARHVPLYRELYADCGVDPATITDFETFHRLPTVTKANLKASFPDRIALDGAPSRDFYPVATSGTTDRVMLFHDERKRDWDRAADLLMLLQSDHHHPGKRQAIIPADACYERCGADEHGRVESVSGKLRALLSAGRGRRKQAAREVLSVFMRDYVWRMKILKAIGVDGTATAPEELDVYVDALREWHPNVLSGLPVYLYMLALHLENSRNGDQATEESRLAVRVRPAGGKLTPEMMRTIERSFGAQVRENFGTAELGTIAFDCAHTREQHLLSELFYIEFVRGDRHVAPGELGEMIVTDFRNHVAPLIRYAVGDVGRYTETPCACGHKGMRFTVEGTVGEVIVTPSGRALAGHEVSDFFMTRPDIDFVRVVQQEVDKFLVEIVPARSAAAIPAAEGLSKSFSAFLECDVKVLPRRVRRLAPERSGKYALVVSSTFERFHGERARRMASARMGNAEHPSRVRVEASHARGYEENTDA
ncbi:MAG: phenylacetate--CoA ligase family protein [Planctomycetes bacterium]|nr:phenylacetate--CoA ligase family protein [Planctomycetota bacterium]